MWTTAFALPHTARVSESMRQQSRSANVDDRDYVAHGTRLQQHHDITVRASAREKKLTVDQLEEFGFFSGLRAILHADIMLARFDLTELIGT
jgi:hypothetical protein